MRTKFSYKIDNDPEPEDAGTIRVTARIFGEDDNSTTFTTVSLAKDFIDDENHECKSKEELNYFLFDAGMNDDIISDAIMDLVFYVDEVTCPASSEYSPGCALKVRLALVPDYLDDDDDDDSQSLIQEAVQVSFDDTSNIRFRPASKLVVESLIRKIYTKKKIEKKNMKKKKKEIDEKMMSLEECTICLQEFSNGCGIMTLPCGHVFDDYCIVKWLKTSHVCPLCRFELPCEDST